MSGSEATQQEQVGRDSNNMADEVHMNFILL